MANNFKKGLNGGLLAAAVGIVFLVLYALFIAVFANVTLPVDGGADWLLPVVDHAVFVKILITENVAFFGFLLAVLGVLIYFFYRHYKKHI